MTNPKTDYNDYVRANLPLGMVYNGTVDRYQTNDHSFVTYKEADWYYNYIINNFDPVSLDPKILIDPSDLSTMFQDTAGTTPVTSSGDPVGLVLDKSQGLELGENLFLAGPMFSSPWTDNGDGSYTKQAGLNGSFDVQGLSSGDFAEIRLTITGSGGEALNLFDGDNQLLVTFSGDGSHRAFFRAEGSARATFFNLNKTSFGGTISNLSLRTVKGNHLTAPSGSSRPTYQTDGTSSWLEFDGVDDQLEAPTRFGLSANPSILSVYGVRPSSYSTDAARLWQLGATGVAGTLSGALGTQGLSWRFNNGNRIFENVPAGNDCVITHSRQAGDSYGDSKAFVNGAESAQTSTSNTTDVPTNTAQFFYVSLIGNAFQGRLYSLTLLEEHTQSQRAAVERWAKRRMPKGV